MELNKLKLAEKIFSKIHIGKNCGNCPEYRVHEETLKESRSETYLSDVISEKGTLGHRRVQVGLMLRGAMFANGILCNSEAWHNITNKKHRRT